MPATAQSLRLTDAYRAKLSALTKAAQRDAKVAWKGMSWNDLSGSYGPIANRVYISIFRAQTEAVRLTAGYLGAYLSSELGTRVAPPIVHTERYVGKSYGNLPLRQSLDSPRVSLLAANKRGDADPMGQGLRALLVNVDLDVKHAAREALREAMEADDRIVGWRRAVKGTCDACMGMAEASKAPPGTPLEIHPGCECVSEAEVKPQVSQAQMQSAATSYVRGSTKFNRKLWAGEDLQGTEAQTAQALDAAIEASPLKEGMTLWRGMPLDAADVSVGDEMFSRGFMSTTPSQDRAVFYAEGVYGEGEPTLLRVVGKKAADMEKLVPEDARRTLDLEPEKVFARNSKMTVTKISYEQFESPLYGINKRVRIVDVRIVG